MLILLPISRSDATLVPPLAKHIHALGGVKRHDLVLFYAGPEALAAADEAEDILRGDFHSVTKVDSGVKDDRGWPGSANSMFRSAIAWAERESGYRGPLYFFEADNVPLKPSWADDLQDEYLRCGKECLGVVHDTVWTSPDGEKTIDGRHLVGTSIYTIPMSPYCRLWRLIPAGAVTPFDVFLRNDIVPKSANTALIQHNWSTCKYRRSGDQIVCSPSDVRGGAEHHAQPVRREAVVLHGCKDSSLVNLFSKPASKAASKAPAEPEE